MHGMIKIFNLLNLNLISDLRNSKYLIQYGGLKFLKITYMAEVRNLIKLDVIRLLRLLNPDLIFLNFNPLGPDGSYMIHGSHGRNNCLEAKGLVDIANFLFSKMLISRLNADQPFLIYQL